MKKFNTLLLAFLITGLVFTPPIFAATLGYQIDMLLSQVRTSTGGVLSNGHVHFYEPGTTTDKAVWTTVNKTTPAANPFNLDANGTGYVFGDGLYRIVVHSAPDTTSPLGVVTHGPTAYDFDNIRYEDYGSAVARFTSLAGDNTGTLSGFKTITGPGTGNISGFDNGTFTGRVTTATLTVSGTPTFTDNTINGVDLLDGTVTSGKLADNTLASAKILDNTIALGKINSSGTKDNTTFLRGDGVWSKATGRGALVVLGSPQSLVNGAGYAAISFTGADTYDTDSIHSVTTDNTKLVVPTGVTMVRLTAQASFAANDNSARLATIFKSGSSFGAGQPIQYQTTNSGTYTTILSLNTSVIEVTAGNYFELMMAQDSGGALNASAAETWFAMEIIR